jgi:hypothetical protein
VDAHPRQLPKTGLDVLPFAALLPGAKSDATDAVLLANIVRTDPDAHRVLPADTELAQAIRVLARAQQDAVSSRQQSGNQIRDLLKDFYPGALAAFAGLPDGALAGRDARTVLAAAPTPTQAAKLTTARLRRLPRHTRGEGRFRSKDAYARHNGPAPLPVWSSNKQRHRLSRTGNRQLNAALHRIALTQARCYPLARELLERRKNDGDGDQRQRRERRCIVAGGLGAKREHELVADRRPRLISDPGESLGNRFGVRLKNAAGARIRRQRWRRFDVGDDVCRTAWSDGAIGCPHN